MTNKKLLDAFKNEICARGNQIDPGEERDWWDMSYGFFIAKGATPSRAHTLATRARYQLQYWMIPVQFGGGTFTELAKKRPEDLKKVFKKIGFGEQTVSRYVSQLSQGNRVYGEIFEGTDVTAAFKKFKIKIEANPINEESKHLIGKIK